MEEIIDINKSIYNALKTYLEGKGYTIGNGNDEIEILHAYPDATDEIHLPSMSLDYSIITPEEDDEELGFCRSDYDFELGIFARDYQERDKLLAVTGGFFKQSIILYNYPVSATPIAYGTIRFSDVEMRPDQELSEQEERKFASAVFFTASIVKE